MPNLAIALGLLAVVLLGLMAFTRANPATLSRQLRTTGGVALLGLALLLLLRGQIALVAMLLGIGLPLLFGRGLLQARKKAPGGQSQVQTATLRMALDHDSATMEGEVLAGRFAGRRLSALSRDELLALLVDCRAGDGQSVPLVEAYLDHRFADWRDAVGAGAGNAGGVATPSAGAMTAIEARQVLGVGPQAGTDEIHEAWRALMKRNHPDQGGSSYLAAKINEAKDVLLSKPTTQG